MVVTYYNTIIMSDWEPSALLLVLAAILRENV